MINMNMQIREAGFTILEMMIAVAVLGLIVSFAAPSFNEFSAKQAIKSDIQRFSRLLTTARSLALTANDAASTVCWNGTNADASILGVPVSANTIAVYSGERPALGTLGTLEATQSLVAGQSSYQSSETDGCIAFDSQGRLNDASGALWFLVCRESGDNVGSERIEVGATGRVIVRPNSSTRGVGVQTC